MGWDLEERDAFVWGSGGVRVERERGDGSVEKGGVGWGKCYENVACLPIEKRCFLMKVHD